MIVKLLFPIAFFTLIAAQVVAQKTTPKFSLGIESQFIIAGETNASFDFLIGGRGTYFFKQKGKFDLFSSVGFGTDIANNNARLIAFDTQIGSYWRKQKKLSFFASIGPQYMHETHSILFIEGERDWQETTWGLTSNLGLTWSFTKSFSSSLFIKQTNLIYTSVGLGLNYSF